MLWKGCILFDVRFIALMNCEMSCGPGQNINFCGLLVNVIEGKVAHSLVDILNVWNINSPGQR